MKRFLTLIAVAALCVGCSTTRSFSADVLPTKAPPKAQPSFLTTGYTGSGFYFGLYTQGGGGSVKELLGLAQFAGDVVEDNPNGGAGGGSAQ